MDNSLQIFTFCYLYTHGKNFETHLRVKFPDCFHVEDYYINFGILWNSQSRKLLLPQQQEQTLVITTKPNLHASTAILSTLPSVRIRNVPFFGMINDQISNFSSSSEEVPDCLIVQSTQREDNTNLATPHRWALYNFPCQISILPCCFSSKVILKGTVSL